MRIWVTGYLNEEDLNLEDRDSSSPTGLSEAGFLKYANSLGLEDVEFERVDD